MSITLRCPECNATLAISQHAKDSSIRCSRCQALLPLPDREIAADLDTANPNHATGRPAVRLPGSRDQGDALRVRADNLNNQAVSLISLGKPTGADQLFERALRIAPNHPEAIFNRELLHWRFGRVTDVGLLRRLEELRLSHPGDWRGEYYLAMIYAERGDLDSASKHLDRASEQGGDPEVEVVRNRLASSFPQSVQYVEMIAGNSLAITALCLSEDSQQAISLGRDGTLRVWNLADANLVRTISIPVDECECLATTPDLHWAVTGSTTISLWDVACGERVRTFQGHAQLINSLALSADGAVILSGGHDKTVRIWDAASGDCTRILEGHHAAVSSVALSADGRWAISGTGDGELWMWDVGSGQRIRVFETPEPATGCICMSRDGRWVLSSDGDAKLHLYSTKNGMRVRTLRGHNAQVTSVSLSGDGRWAISGGLDETLRLWDVTTGCCLRTLDGPMAGVCAVALDASGQRGLSGGIGGPSKSGENVVRVWDFATFHRSGGRFVAPPARCRVAPKEEAKPGQMLFNGMLAQARALADVRRPDEAIYLVEQARKTPGFGTNPQAIALRHGIGEQGVRERYRDGRCTQTFRGPAAAVGPIALSPDASHAITGSSDKMVRLWDLTKVQCELTLAGHTASINDLCYLPDGQRAISASEDGTLRLWDLAGGTCLRILEGHASWVSCVAASPDGRFAISGGRDKTLRLWDLTSGECLRVYTGHENLVRAVRISDCGRWALTGSFDKTLRLWEIASGRCLQTFSGHADIIHCVALSSDGRWALSGSNDKTIRLWDLATGRCARVLQDRNERILAISISSDARWAMSGSGDKQLRLWSLASGQCVQILSGHTSVVTSVDMSRDCRWTISGSHDQTLRLWELEWDYTFPEPADWDEGARPFLENFLVLHTPYQQESPQVGTASGEDNTLAVTRAGSPQWTDDDFSNLLAVLRRAGFGWLRPEGVRQKLDEMAALWAQSPA